MGVVRGDCSLVTWHTPRFFLVESSPSPDLRGNIFMLKKSLNPFCTMAYTFLHFDSAANCIYKIGMVAHFLQK
jgi:hypothetical protein